MGRRDTPIDALDGMVAEFALDLRDVRDKAGSPTYQKMARKTGFTAPALSGAARGERPPTWQVTKAYLTACDVTGEATLRLWRQRLAEVRQWYAGRTAGRGTPAQRRAAVAAYTAPIEAAEAEPDQPLLTGEVLQMLHQLKNHRRLSYRQIAARSASNPDVGRALTSSTTQEVLTGKRPITGPFVLSYLDAVEATVDQRSRVGRQLAMELRFHDAAARMKMAITSPDEDHLGSIAELSDLVIREGNTVKIFEVKSRDDVARPATVPSTTAIAATVGQAQEVTQAATLKPKVGRHRAKAEGRLPKLVTSAKAGLALMFGDITELARTRA